MYDVAIIGCGITGAATAFELSKYELKTVVLERENDIAMGATRANSAIIHAGYDPEPGTLMARLNVKGCAMAKELCAALDVPYKNCGSLVLAFTDADIKTIRELCERGIQNGVPGLRVLSADEVHKIEPNASENVAGALYAPTAGIVNPWEYALALAETAVRNGVGLIRNAFVSNIERENGFYRLTAGGRTFDARYVVNAAGVDSAIIHEFVAPKEFAMRPSRGEYFLLDKCEGDTAKHVLFQCPTDAGKGVLISPTVHGNLIVGPSAISSDDMHRVNTTRDGLAYVRSAAEKSVKRLNFRNSIRNFAGMRANTDRADFIVGMAADRFLDLAGIKSPGLSCAPALAEEAVRILSENGLTLVEKPDAITERKRPRFKDMSDEEKNAAIKRNPLYGRVICRCETITEGEIVDAIRSPIPPCSVDSVKRRAGTGMGRCQGGFCAPRVLDILSRELGVSPADIPKDGAGSYILTGETKEAHYDA